MDQLAEPEGIMFPISQEFIANLGVIASHKKTTEHDVLMAGIAWYDTDLADDYKRLRLDELKDLPERQGRSGFGYPGQKMGLMLDLESEEIIGRVMVEEGLTLEEAVKKIGTVFMQDQGIDEMTADNAPVMPNTFVTSRGFVSLKST